MHLRTIIIALLFIPIALMAAACSDTPSDSSQADPEPDPPPQNESIEVVTNLPSSYAWDAPVDKRFRASHPDGFSEGFVEFYVNGERVWSIDAANRGSIDTTWTHSFDLETTPMDFTADLEVKYSLVDSFERVEDRNSVSGTENIAVTRSPFTETTVQVQDFFTQEPVTGSLTLRGNRTVPVVNGEASLSRFEKVHKDSLENGLYRILLEASGYVTHSSILTPKEDGLREVNVLPEQAEDWSYELYADHLYPTSQGDVLTQRLKDGETYTVWIYRNHYFEGCENNTRSCAVESSDTNLLGSESYLNDAGAVWTQTNSYLLNVDIEVKEDTKDSGFPTKTQEQTNVVLASGSPGVPFSITQGHRINHPAGEVNNNYIHHVIMFQRTDPPATFTIWAVWADVINSLALDNNGKERETVIPELDNSRPTPFALNAIATLYSTEAGSGVHNNANQANSQGVIISTVPDWVPTFRTNITSVINKDAF